MRIRYFADTDTLYIEFRDHGIVDSRDLDGNTTIDLDAEGNVLALTLEHASGRTDVRQLVLEGISDDPGSVPTSKRQLAEARRRLADHDADASSAISWAEAERKLRQKK